MKDIKERWLPAGIVAGVLFAVNLIARLVVRIVAGEDDGKQTWMGLTALIAVGAVVLVAAVWWNIRFSLPRTVGDLAVAVVIGSLLSVLIGPFVSSGEAFADGFGGVVLQFLIYLAVCGLGGLFGTFGVIAAGKDQKSVAWQRYAEAIQAREGRPPASASRAKVVSGRGAGGTKAAKGEGRPAGSRR